MPLLERIAASPKLSQWCLDDSPYNSDHADTYNIRKPIYDFIQDAYDCGLIPPDYRATYDTIGIPDLYNRIPRGDELKNLTSDQIIATIAMQFRADHFDNGYLIRRSIGDGIMLPYLQELANRML